MNRSELCGFASAAQTPFRSGGAVAGRGDCQEESERKFGHRANSHLHADFDVEGGFDAAALSVSEFPDSSPG